MASRAALARPLTGTVVALVAVLVLTAWRSGEAWLAPSAELWERWQAHNPSSQATIDASAWTAFVTRYVRPTESGLNVIAYGAVTAEDRQALDALLVRWSQVPISQYGRNEQLAFWINLYNALTLRVVLDHLPVDSIRDIDISPGLFSDGPWDKALITIEGEPLTLNDIEHRILRPIWRDARIHYAVNCASVGCPNLRAKAYSAAAIDAELDAQARAFVNSPRGVLIDGDSITVSKIYDWFIEDFGGDEQGVIAHLARFAEPPLRAEIARIGSLSGVRYDWSLNDIGATGS